VNLGATVATGIFWRAAAARMKNSSAGVCGVLASSKDTSVTKFPLALRLRDVAVDAARLFDREKILRGDRLQGRRRDGHRLGHTGMRSAPAKRCMSATYSAMAASEADLPMESATSMVKKSLLARNLSTVARPI